MGDVPHIHSTTGGETAPLEDRELLDDLPPTLVALHHQLRTMGARWRAMLATSGHTAAEAPVPKRELPESATRMTDPASHTHEEPPNEAPEGRADQRRKQRKRSLFRGKKGRQATGMNPLLPLSISVALSAAVLLTTSSMLSTNAICCGTRRVSRRAA